jgi:hypothetical protein
MYFFFGFSIDSNILKFMKGIKQMRTYLIDTVRKSAPAIFSIGSVTDHNSYSTRYDLSGPLCAQTPPAGKVLSEDNYESPEWAVLIKLRHNEGTRAV